MSDLEPPIKFCPTCGTVTRRNKRKLCLVCQKRRAKSYGARRKAAGGGFSAAVRRELRAAHPERCPNCGTAWSEVPKHERHPRTPWHFDHHVPLSRGGTSDPGNARIMCWPCNLTKLDRQAF